jgi:hypothetical protein
MFAVGYFAAPVLFTQLADRALAGNIAGALFSLIALGRHGLCGYLLLYLLLRRGLRAFQSSVFWMVLAMLGLALAHFGIQPIIVAAQGRRPATPGDGERPARSLCGLAWRRRASCI